MSYNEDQFMETFDKWNDRDRRQRFIQRMNHKLYTKEHRFDRAQRS